MQMILIHANTFRDHLKKHAGLIQLWFLQDFVWSLLLDGGDKCGGNFPLWFSVMTELMWSLLHHYKFFNIVTYGFI